MNAKEKLKEMNHILNVFEGYIEVLDDSADALDMQRFDEVLREMYEENVLKDLLRFARKKHKRVKELESETLIDGMTPTEVKRQFQSLHKDWLDKKRKVEELENVLEQDKRQEVIERMYLENQRYREALEFYADPRNYKDRDFGMVQQIAIQTGDKGNTAREALESEAE